MWMDKVNIVPFSEKERNNQSDQPFTKDLAGFAMKVPLRFHPKRGLTSDVFKTVSNGVIG